MTNGDSLPSALPFRSPNVHGSRFEPTEQTRQLEAAIAANLRELGYDH